jgi:Zn-finger protein
MRSKDFRRTLQNHGANNVLAKLHARGATMFSCHPCHVVHRQYTMRIL